MLDKSKKKKEDSMCKIAIRNAGMKQDDIASVSECCKQTFRCNSRCYCVGMVPMVLLACDQNTLNVHLRSASTELA